MKRVLTLAAALCVLAFGAAFPGTAQAITTTCPAYSQVVANVTYSVAGDPVTDAAGNVWATANYTRTLMVVRVTRTTYCATWRDTGTFTTVDAASPGGSGHVAAGITGRLTRSATTNTFTATWQPNAPTSGPLGIGPSDWTSLYFESPPEYGLNWYTNLYTTAANGSWGSRTGYPSYCDITSPTL